jgi:hypothetical protein
MMLSTDNASRLSASGEGDRNDRAGRMHGALHPVPVGVVESTVDRLNGRPGLFRTGQALIPVAGQQPVRVFGDYSYDAPRRELARLNPVGKHRFPLYGWE